jgi:microcystin degradation protein MlrC
VKRRRILSGGIAQESHSFIEKLTTRERFSVLAGHNAIADARGTNTQLGGIVDTAEAAGFEIQVPLIATSAAGGLVDDGLFREFAEAFLDAARKGDFDAIVLAMHGAMQTPSLQDPEGHLMRSLRRIVGDDVPITASFDLHGHVTPDTLAPCDFLAGFLTNPHADLAETGRRAFRAARGMLEDGLALTCAYVHLPMLTLGNDRTDSGPLLNLHRRVAESVGSRKAYDVSIFNAQQFLDVDGLGQAVLVYDLCSEAAAQLASSLAGELWRQRQSLIGSYPRLDGVLASATRGGSRLIVGDQGCRVAAGSLGDSTFVLHRVIATGYGGRTAIPIADAEALGHCRAAGVGSELTLTFGGRNSRGAPPATLSGRVLASGRNASAKHHGPYFAGMPATIASYAIFQAGNVTVVITTEPCMFLDPGYYEAIGLNPLDFDLIVSRSGYHFSLNFASLGRCITVDTPGPTSYDIAQFDWKHARPFYPLDTVPEPDLEPLLLRPRKN